MNNIKFYEKNNIGKATYIKDADYLNHRTGRYTIWSKRIAVKFWVQVDYYDLFEGNITDIGRTFLLINSIDYNNIVCKMDAPRFSLRNPLPRNRTNPPSYGFFRNRKKKEKAQ